MIQNDKDTFVKMRKMISRRHMNVSRKAKLLSAEFIRTPTPQVKEEALKKEGEKEGLCFALKVLDRACQTEFHL